MISLILPAHNEANAIRGSVHELDRELSRVFPDVEILVVDDGSTDQTLAQLDKLNLSAELVLIHRTTRIGKGGALRAGFSRARGTVVAYTDADLPISPVSVIKAIAEVESGACDVCVGDRYASSSVRSGDGRRLRMFAGWVYRAYVRLILPELPRDPACCLKAFSRKIASCITADSRLDSYLFDVEALVIASRSGASIKEIGVNWVDKRAQLPLVRIPGVVFGALRATAVLRRKYGRDPTAVSSDLL